MMKSMLEPTCQPGTPSRRFRYTAMAPLPTCSFTIEMMYALAADREQVDGIGRAR